MERIRMGNERLFGKKGNRVSVARNSDGTIHIGFEELHRSVWIPENTAGRIAEYIKELVDGNGQ